MDVGPIVVVVGDPARSAAHPLVLALGLGHVEIVATVATAGDAADVATRAGAGIAVVDLDASDAVGIVRDLRVLAPSVRVVGWSAAPHAAACARALAAGACGAVDLTDAHGVEIALDAASRGDLVLPSTNVPALAEVRQRRAGPRYEIGRLADLTAREREVLSLVAIGCTTPEIARRLAITTATVQSHVKNVLAKLGVHSKVEAVLMAWRHDGAVPA